MRAGQRCILREGMISSAIEALHSGESRGNHRPEVAADRVPYILPAVAPHTVVAVGACNILYDSGLLKLLFTGNIPRIYAISINSVHRAACCWARSEQ